jgi:tetratricopeptide (TPR) repeat protein
MSKKKIALIIILLGIFINILALPFVQHYNQHAGFIGSLGRMEVVLNEGTRIEAPPAPPAPGTTAPSSVNGKYPYLPNLFPATQNQDRANADISNNDFSDIGIRYAKDRLAENTDRVAFPYRYVFLISVLLVFAGVVLFILSPVAKSGKETNTDPAMRQRPWFKIGGVFLAWLLLYIFLKELWPTGWVLRSMIAPIVFFVIYKLWNQNTDKTVDVDAAAANTSGVGNIYCFTCGKENPDTASFCYACGKQLVISAKSEDKLGKRINPHLFSISLWAGIICFIGGIMSFAVMKPVPATIIMSIGMVSIIFSGIYFLISLYRCWGVLRGFSPRTTPAKAVGFSLIPFFNAYWIFVAIYGLAVDANAFTGQGGSKNRINETLSIATCFIFLLPFVNFIAPILMTFLVYQWANFHDTATEPDSSSFVYPVFRKGKYIQGNYNINKVFACTIAALLIIIIGMALIKAKRQDDARAAAIAEAYYKSGHAYLEEVKSDLALEELNKAIAANPNYAEAYTDRGRAYYYKGQYEKAVEDCSKAIAINPNYAEAYKGRGLAYSSMSYKNAQYDLTILEKAIADFNNAIAINPSYADAYNGLGNAYHRQGQYDLAIDAYSKEIAITNDAYAYNSRGKVYISKGQSDRAILDFNTVIAMGPKNSAEYMWGSYCQAFYQRGYAYAKNGQYDLAIQDYNRVLAMQPTALTIPSAYFNRGLVYTAKGQDDLAIKDFSKEISISPKHNEAYYMRGVVYAGKKNMGKAIPDFQKACDLGNGLACQRLATVQKKK